MMNLIVAFRNFANGPKNISHHVAIKDFVVYKRISLVVQDFTAAE
jgi:hypothetical protein